MNSSQHASPKLNKTLDFESCTQFGKAFLMSSGHPSIPKAASDAHGEIGTRLHQPSGNSAALQGSQGTVHRHLVGFRGKPTQTSQLVTHDGPAAQTHGAATTQLTSQSRPCESSVGSEGRWRGNGSLSTMRTASGAGKACDRAAWAHSNHSGSSERKRAVGSFAAFLDFAKLCEHVGHDHLWQQGGKHWASQIACWCASSKGWRFLEAGR